MDMQDRFRGNHAPQEVADRAELVAYYKRLRAASHKLSNRLAERLPKDILEEGGRKLGILRQRAFIIRTESEMSILMDYCLYDVRRKGRNAIEQYLIESPPDPESDEMEQLRAMQHATYSVFVVESVIPGVGVTVRDILSEEVFLVVDLGFASTAVRDAVFASRLLHHEDFSMTSGAAIPIGVVPEGALSVIANDVSRAIVRDPDGYFDPATLIRGCLEHGCASDIEYQDPTGQPLGRTRSIESSAPRRFSRNAPCPCGSGRKYKKCCMQRREG
ncbi:MAG: SEC-C domain-containing protein [Thermoguttaceae bacterium]|jgi:hypothetical protein|nr:SEC-C domain-containing protein [Thermoguttaceae bacterium]